MSEPKLALCRCGGSAEYVLEDRESRVFAQCSRCRIRTLSRGAELKVAAYQTVADVWNSGAEMWPRWIKPAVPTDGYDMGAQVSHTTGEDKTWEHWISHFDGKNIHEPGVSGWTLVGPAPAE